MSIKIAQFDAEFESVEKVVIKFIRRKCIGHLHLHCTVYVSSLILSCVALCEVSNKSQLIIELNGLD
jgi:hypothetical protein